VLLFYAHTLVLCAYDQNNGVLGRANGSVQPLGECGASTFASEQTKCGRKNSKSAPISQVGCNRWLGGTHWQGNKATNTRV